MRIICAVITGRHIRFYVCYGYLFCRLQCSMRNPIPTYRFSMVFHFCTMTVLKSCDTLRYMQDNLDHVPEHPHQAPSYPPLPNAPNSTRDTPTEDSLLRNSLEHSMIVKKPSIIASVSSGASQRQLFPAEIHTTSDKPQGPYSTLYPTSNPTMDAAATAGGSPSGTAYNYAMRNFTSMESSARATADSEIRTVPEPFTVGIPSHGLETVPSQIDSPSPVAVQSRAMNVLRKENVASEESIKNLNQQLNCFKSKHRFLGKFEMLGRTERRHGGVHL